MMKMAEKVKDPVCEMEIDKGKAKATSEHMGQTYYFCSPSCKESFDKEPMKCMKPEEKGGHHH